MKKDKIYKVVYWKKNWEVLLDRKYYQGFTAMELLKLLLEHGYSRSRAESVAQFYEKFVCNGHFATVIKLNGSSTLTISPLYDEMHHVSVYREDL